MNVDEREVMRRRLRAAQYAISQAASSHDRLPSKLIRHLAQILGELEAALKDCHESRWKN